mmetsp:Transcript_15193/g.36093  ORF Transcript_15193/g.36093 Transcript_15193/m.36093 type:complete len:204 (+) Transcript_15193:703-1314(+)
MRLATAIEGCAARCSLASRRASGTLGPGQRRAPASIRHHGPALYISHLRLHARSCLGAARTIVLCSLLARLPRIVPSAPRRSSSTTCAARCTAPASEGWIAANMPALVPPWASPVSRRSTGALSSACSPSGTACRARESSTRFCLAVSPSSFTRASTSSGLGTGARGFAAQRSPWTCTVSSTGFSTRLRRSPQSLPAALPRCR